MDSGTWWPLIGGRKQRVQILRPVAQGAIADIELPVDFGAIIVDIVADFSGEGLTYGLAPSSDPLPTGLSIAANGFINGTPTELTPARNIVIRATNDFGFADSAFTLAIVELDYEATISGLTNNPTHGPSAQTGVELTASADAFNGPPPSSVTYQWETVESGVIAGATSATYTPDASTYDGETLFCRITADFYPTKTTDVFVIRQVPPTASGGIFDEILDVGSGDELYDVAFDFTGVALTYSVSGPGTSIDASTGRITINSSSSVAGATVTVTALNTGGSATSAFTLTVEDADIGPGPDIGQPDLQDASDTIAFTVDEPCTIYWRRDPTATNPTADMVIAGGGYDSGSFTVSAGENTVPGTFAPGNDGLQEISFVAAVTPTEPSLVQTVAIEIDTTAPVLASSVPQAGANNASVAVNPALTFSEDVQAGSGVVTLYDVTGAAAVETFDVVADAGTGVGQVNVSGATLTIYPSSALTAGNEYAILVDAGAVVDDATHAFAGISSTNTLSFVTGSSVIDTEFGASFTTDLPAVWSSIQANAYNATPEHRGNETWDAYPVSVTDGGIVGVRGGPYPQLRFAITVETGKTYTVDADFPIGEGTWDGPLRVKMGSAMDANDYAQIDVTQAGQPRAAEVRGQQFTATSTTLWFAVIVESSTGSGAGGFPAISKLRIAEV